MYLIADSSIGYIHNRGGSVDITLVDFYGKELDMGTSFDFFGIETSHNYQNILQEIKKYRELLKRIMMERIRFESDFIIAIYLTSFAFKTLKKFPPRILFISFLLYPFSTNAFVISG